MIKNNSMIAPPPEDGLNAKSGQEKIKVAKTLRRKDDKSETEIVAISRHSEGNNNFIPKNLLLNNQEIDNSRKSRHSERIAKESSDTNNLIQLQGIKINSTETDHTSMPLGIFAPKNLAASLPSRLAAKKVAFTLAEVLITLGIIGVVAALTLPTVINKAQSMILKNQFKKAYSTFYNAMKLVQVQNGAPMACWYWDTNPYDAAGNGAKCDGWNEYGNCNHWVLQDNSSLPYNYNGQAADCRKFTEDLMKTMKVVKFCEKDALKNGCLTETYRGTDKVKSEQYPDKEQDPAQTFSDSQIKNRYPAFITTDGTVYIRFYSMSGYPVLTVDVNGHKGPNKWGYDIFTFKIIGNKQDGMTKLKSVNYATDKGGKTFAQMLQSF